MDYVKEHLIPPTVYGLFAGVGFTIAIKLTGIGPKLGAAFAAIAAS